MHANLKMQITRIGSIPTKKPIHSLGPPMNSRNYVRKWSLQDHELCSHTLGENQICVMQS